MTKDFPNYFEYNDTKEKIMAYRYRFLEPDYYLLQVIPKP